MSASQQAYWRAQTQRYDRVTLILNRRFSEMARAVAGLTTGAGDVLEVAAGTGLITAEIASGVGRLVATDASAEMLALLQGRMAESDNVQVRQADALALDFPDASFDVVVIGNLLHLLPEPTQAIQEARRVLRPGGLLIAPTFCHGQGLVAQLISRLLGLIGFPIVTRFKGRELETLLEQEGLSVEEARWIPGLLPLRLAAARG